MNKIIILLITLISSVILAEEPIILNNFTGGLNTRVDSGQIDIKDTQDSYNMVYDDHYTLQSRLGTKLKGTLPRSGQILSQFEFNQQNGKRWYIVQIDSSIFATEDWVTWTTINEKVWSTFYQCNYAIYQDKLWITNGIDTVKTWDGLYLSTYTFISKGRYIVVDSDIIWISGVAGSPSTVYFSVANLDPTSTDAWNGGNAIQINEDDGDIITWISIYQGRKVIFKKRGIYGMTGNSVEEIFVRNYSNKWGCIDGASVQNFKEKLVFLSNDGLRAFDGGVVSLISEKIYNDLRNINQINSGGLFEWRLNKDSEFEKTVLKTNVDIYGNSIQLSTMNYTWNSDTTFGTLRSSVNCMIQNGMIRISTTTSLSETEISPIAWDIYDSGLNKANNSVTAKDWAFDTSTISACTIDMKVRYNAFNFGNRSDYLSFKNYWTIKEGNDEVTIIGLFAECNITKLSWIYELTNGLNETGTRLRKSYIKAEFVDLNNRNDWLIINPFRSTGYARDHYATNFPDGQGGGITPTAWSDILRYFNYTTLQWYGDSEFYDNPYQDDYIFNCRTSGVRLRIFLTPRSDRNSQFIKVRDLKLYQRAETASYNSTGTYISGTWNTGYATPVWGLFEATVSTTSANTIKFGLETSADGSNWSIAKEILPGQNITDIGIAKVQYIRWVTTMTSVEGAFTQSPLIYSVKINAIKNDGSFYSPVYNIRNISKWHIFAVTDNSTLNKSTITYKIGQYSIASPAPGGDSAILANQDINGILTPNNNTTYIRWRTDFVSNDGTQNPYTASVGVGWFTGSQVKNVASCVYNNRYYLSVSTGSDSYNNVVYLFDNNAGFVRYEGITAATLITGTDNNIYYGDGTSNKIYQMETDDTDNGKTINTMWISKDFDFGDVPVYIDNIAITGKCNVSTNTITLSYSPGFTTSWTDKTIQLSSGTYSTEIINMPSDNSHYNYKFKVTSSNNNFNYDIRKITIYYSRDEFKPGIHR